MGRRRKTADSNKPTAKGHARGEDAVSAIDGSLEVASALRDFAAELADLNPDNPYAQCFAVEVRKAKSALAEAKHYLRQALGMAAIEAREGAEREMTSHATAMRPDVE